MSTEKIEELARDIAREQYTDDPDDPDRVVYVAEDGIQVTQRELDEIERCAVGYCVRNKIYPFT